MGVCCERRKFQEKATVISTLRWNETYKETRCDVTSLSLRKISINRNDALLKE